MNRRTRTAAPWVAVAAAVAALFGTGQLTPSGLERLGHALWRAVSSEQRGTFHPRASTQEGRRDAPHAADGEPIAGTARIVDGDTLDLGRIRIRMGGIDALEHDQSCTRPGDRSYDCGKLARDALVALIGGATVTCQPDGSETYGRTVAICTVPGRDGAPRDLNTAMVRTGLAFDCPKFSGGRYAEAERAARAARSGAWAGSFEFPWRHRGRDAACGRD
ncbi:thermonuclease family protein [Roseomonas haemaphysalidis]|uniref:Thermonuclease family protein n=1 Tax=Roseomonas haemaphysalidis TaxID=2768162 RepID=A0ABS3KP13_9PROT|nr:thermonuclease family protein [Roseomonas haemaphysalidis]MBO1079207.1 thermonuclease family protein [Roseomonas haemaphysalidis]